MTIRVYNTLTRAKEPFEPMIPGKVRMYVCGPTVYDSCHIGHARSVVVFDMIFRYLIACGYEVTYVRNFTDIDDKIINRANELGMTTQALAEKYIIEFHEDMDALNNLRPTIEPKATEHIPQIIVVIQRLFENGYAYAADGDVFFRVSAHDGYGKLSGRKLDDMEAGARVDIDTRKENPFDFVLWKASKPGEPFWDSPWGKGRPGWHIECSAMGADYLGESFDIHGGGKDLIFPHHENEIAQSEAAFGKTFVKYWLHNGFVNIDQEKMSKSLGNFRTIREILKTCHPEALRLFLLSSHYRSPVDFNEQAIRDAGVSLDKIYALLERIEKSAADLPDLETAAAVLEETQTKDWRRFSDAMNDDFNSALASGVLFDVVRTFNRRLDALEAGAGEEDKTALGSQIIDLLRMGRILGIMAESPGEYMTRRRQMDMAANTVDPEAVEALIREREAARADRDFKKADEIRDRLKTMNIVLEDRSDGTGWKFIR
ncbi:MAG: cysteine--tRNA ligase [Desulfobacteraceae bacterium]|jgi:cysteinyl-tRNA synthetase|nr:MAG: cysteine--tRNA ligase [Desulfobacteraceae bacterium]